MEIIAHRGASYSAPENTLPAILRGWEEADAVEVDVHLSRDGEIVVIHDPRTLRVGGLDRLVSDQSLAELKALDAGAWKGAEWVGTRIPTLQEVVETIPPSKRLFIEIKCGPEVFPRLTSILAERDPRRFVFIGFSLPVMREAKRRFPGTSGLWLRDVADSRRKGELGDVGDLVHRVCDAGLDGVDLKADDAVDDALARAVREAGLHLAVWTVDDLPLARRMAALGVNSLTTNRPGWMCAALGL